MTATGGTEMTQPTNYTKLAREMIDAERARHPQLGYDEAHDRGREFQLGAAGNAYAWHADKSLRYGEVPVGWPWAAEYWKPRTPRRDLTRAGALYLAAADAASSRNNVNFYRKLADRAILTLSKLLAKPEIITLCGSTKFKEAIHAENMRLTMEGKLVISLGVFGHTDLPDYDWTTDASDLKRMLDALHRQKIDLADAVHVVNPGGYYGESTAAEIAYAESFGIPITYLEPRP